MPTYVENENSVQDADLREIYVFDLTTGTHNLTGHDDDVTYDAVTYTSTPGLSRGTVELSPLTQQRQMTITLPIDHAIVLGLLPIPPRDATVTITRVHAGATAASDQRRQIWSGTIAEVQLDGGNGDNPYARIRVSGAVDVLFDVALPVLRVMRSCQHQLYSTACTVTKSGSNGKTPTVAAVSGTTIATSSLSGWTFQARHGEVIRTADGERRSIIEQSGNAIVVDVPFATLNVGDALQIWRGCDKQASTCAGEFLNIQNFGGHPDVPIANPASPTGKGVA